MSNNRISHCLNSVFEKYRCLINRRRLKNKNFTIISSNCNGGVILHDLGLRFDTPTINLYFTPDDYLKLVKNLKLYLSTNLVESKENSSYPIGILQDIKVHFLHYNSFEEAKEKWIYRCNRVHWDNLYFMFTDRNGCKYEQLVEFDRLPMKHKVAFTHLKYTELKSSFYIKGFEDENCVGVLSNFRYYALGKKYYDDFNYVNWLNSKD